MYRHYTRRERQKIYQSARWRRLRLAILDRDGRRCRKCGAAGRLEVHHVEPIKYGGALFAPDNLLTMCRTCHFRAEPDRQTDRLKWGRVLDDEAGIFRVDSAEGIAAT